MYVFYGNSYDVKQIYPTAHSFPCNFAEIKT